MIVLKEKVTRREIFMWAKQTEPGEKERGWRSDTCRYTGRIQCLGGRSEVAKSSSQGQNNSHSHMRNNVNKYVGVTSSDGGCLVPSAHILR